MAHKRGNIWWISYTDASGCKIRHSAQTRSKREAEKLEQRLKTEAAQLITAARLIPKQNYLAPLIILALNTGIRRLEMLG